MQAFTITVLLPESSDPSDLLEHLQASMVEFAQDQDPDIEDDDDRIGEIEASVSVETH